MDAITQLIQAGTQVARAYSHVEIPVALMAIGASGTAYHWVCVKYNKADLERVEERARRSNPDNTLAIRLFVNEHRDEGGQYREKIGNMTLLPMTKALLTDMEDRVEPVGPEDLVKAVKNVRDGFGKRWEAALEPFDPETWRGGRIMQAKHLDEKQSPKTAEKISTEWARQIESASNKLKGIKELQIGSEEEALSTYQRLLAWKKEPLGNHVNAYYLSENPGDLPDTKAFRSRTVPLYTNDWQEAHPFQYSEKRTLVWLAGATLLALLSRYHLSIGQEALRLWAMVR